MNLGIDVKGLKIGLWLDAGFGEEVGEETKAAVEASAKLLPMLVRSSSRLHHSSIAP